VSALHGILGGTITALGVSMVAAARHWPATATPTRAVLDEASLNELLDGGEIEANDFAYCPAEERTTFHAIRSDGSRRCWTCNSESPAGAK
jgi:hypothetical protein